MTAFTSLSGFVGESGYRTGGLTVWVMWKLAAGGIAVGGVEPPADCFEKRGSPASEDFP